MSAQADLPDTLGRALDDLATAVGAVNAASARMRGFGVAPHLAVNGIDYGDQISLWIDHNEIVGSG